VGGVTDQETIALGEEPVPQVDDCADTDIFADTIIELAEPFHTPCTPTSRAVTSSEWPPPPPLPTALSHAFAIGTDPPRRVAQVYAVVRRPTTSSGDSQ